MVRLTLKTQLYITCLNEHYGKDDDNLPEQKSKCLQKSPTLCNRLLEYNNVITFHFQIIGIENLRGHEPTFQGRLAHFHPN